MNRLPLRYFERVYAAEDDPWGFEVRWYERRKYALTLAALPAERYASAFEPGCSFGVLTEQLAPRCAKLIAMELVPSVAERVKARVARFEHVQVECGPIPDAWPSERFDLVVLSEVLYYLSEAALGEILSRLEDSTRAGAHIVAVHYRGETDYPMTGDAVHAALAAARGYARLVHHEEPAFALDVFERTAR